MSIKDFFVILKQAFVKSRQDHASQQAAALAFYTLFSLAPLAIVVVHVVGLLYGEAAARGELVEQIDGLIGSEAAVLVQTAVENAGRRGSGIVATLLGLGALGLGATTVFVQLQRGLNAMWNVQVKPGAGIRHLIKSRLLSFGVVISLGFLLVVSLLASTAISVVAKYLTGFVPGLGPVLHIVEALLSVAIISLLFAAVFRYLPDVEIGWHHVMFGSVLTAILFTVGKSLISLYLVRSTTVSAYGATGSLVIILLWVYYSAQIVFFGTEFTQVLAKRRGEHIQPSTHAEFTAPLT